VAIVSSPIHLLTLTSIPAVAERPRDASCLSVVSFNSTKRPAHSYFGFIFKTTLRHNYEDVLCTNKFCSIGGAENAGIEDAGTPWNAANLLS